MTSLEFSSFDYVDTDIIIPEGVIFYRGVPRNAHAVISDKPIYLANERIAKEYGDKVVQIQCQKPLRLLDVRKLKNHIRLVITSRVRDTVDTVRAIFFLTIAFGLCSYDKQVQLLQHFLDENETTPPVKADFQKRLNVMKNAKTGPLNPLEPEGVRVAETSIDGHVMLILKELYKGLYDGYIAPRLHSPFHAQGSTHEEVVVFDPIQSGLFVLEKHVVTKPTQIQDMLHMSYLSFRLSFKDVMVRKMYMGGDPTCKYTKDKNAFFEDVMYAPSLKRAEKLAKRMHAVIPAPRHVKNVCNLSIQGSPKIPRAWFADC